MFSLYTCDVPYYNVNNVRQYGDREFSQTLDTILRLNYNWVLFFFNFIYLFLAVLCLRFCARAFSSCGKRGPLFIAVRGPLSIAASLVAEHRL